MATSDPKTERKYLRAKAVLAAAYERSNQMEPRQNGRPFAALIPESQKLVDEVEDDDEFEQRKEHFRAFITFIFADGLRPDRVLKRVYALAWFCKREVLLGMSMREVGDLCGEGRASVSNRVNKKFSDYLARWEFDGTRTTGQKREETRATYAERAMGNSNRRLGKRKDEAPKK